MTKGSASRWWVDAARGAVAGGIATWVMDMMTTGILSNQPDSVKQQEERVRPNHKSSVENLVDRVGAATGATPNPTLAHYALGVLPGAVYALLRSRVPLVGLGRGLGFGVLLWLVNDELLNSRFGLAAPIDAYPAETHWRGFVGHAVLGAATETGIDLLGG